MAAAKPKRGVKTRGGESMTEAAYWGKARSALRKLWMHWPVRTQVLNQRRIVASPKKGQRHKFEYLCNHCDKYFPNKEVEVDHIIPAGNISEDMGAFYQRLLCEADNLQVLCKPCHAVKTQEDRNR